MPHLEHPDGRIEWTAPGGLSPIPKEELHRTLDADNIEAADLDQKTPYLADKIRDMYEKSSGEKLNDEDLEAFQALIRRESAGYLARRPHP